MREKLFKFYSRRKNYKFRKLFSNNKIYSRTFIFISLLLLTFTRGDFFKKIHCFYFAYKPSSVQSSTCFERNINSQVCNYF